MQHSDAPIYTFVFIPETVCIFSHMLLVCLPDQPADRPAAHGVIVHTKHKSPNANSERPLFTSPVKQPRLPEAARGDEASLPGGGPAVWRLRKRLPLQLQG